MSKLSTVHLVFMIMCCHLLLLDIRDGIQIRDDTHVEPIRRTLDGLQLKLCEYDTEVEALENTLTNLKKGHASLAHSIQVYKPYLAPIRRLPVELLRKISRKHAPFLLAKPYTKPSTGHLAPYCHSLLLLAKYLLIFAATLVHHVC
ncbi:hypothetical protein IW261DRAFT_929111 [Armillaria novae-zelandiae]|uniref:Uncharacterized protein n=1 Tax=Armillaria novae-zelandiae TaxID=153914 RepID=A0AA39NS09_9AGAR|nr:hypothetical protein IW261DRAFT_929111 [Armillaria novae-zelandiae]